MPTFISRRAYFPFSQLADKLIHRFASSKTRFVILVFKEKIIYGCLAHL